MLKQRGKRRPARRKLTALLTTLLIFAVTPLLGSRSAMADSRPNPPNACQLKSAGGEIQHVIYLIFDNVHFTRDNPNVPSDLEQMPTLLHFIQANGTLETNHHAVLISHTANDILTTLTGVYSDRHGIPVANSYGVFRPDGTTAFPSSFFYWTDLVSDVTPSSGDGTFGMLTAGGKNAPAPWVPFTRAGCDVGMFAMANTIIERTAFDVPKIFGKNSPEAAEDAAHQLADFEGVGVHCAQGSALCSPANHGVPDLLPDEPGGYTGYSVLIGAKYLAAALGGPLKDLGGNVIVNPDSGLPGFPGFDPTASQSLGYIATMQEAGIPVTFAYIEDAHDDHVNGVAFGPGEAGYVAQLQAFDAAFGKFFARLQADGITPSNTLFIITSDEGDHFAGGRPRPANCDGITTPCTYSQIGELDLNLNGLVASQKGNTTPFSIHFDLAPTVYITGNPSSTASVTRQLERDLAGLTALNPLTGNTDTLAAALADPVEMGLLHMITADPARTSSFTLFGAPDYFFLSSGSTTPTEDPGFAWNHGGIQPEIARTWLGLVGPGVRRKEQSALGQPEDSGQAPHAIQFSDHTDVRPTVLALLGLQDDYVHDGRVLIEVLHPAALPQSLTAHFQTLLRLGRTYKAINAPFGRLGQNSLRVSTAALASNAPGDDTYTALESKIASWRTQRDALAAPMRAMLESAAFGGQPIDEEEAKQLIESAEELLNDVSQCAANTAECAQ